MKKPSFSSLTLRIWTTFVIFIMVIIIAISLIYFVFARSLMKKSQLENLQSLHNTLLGFMTQSADFSFSKSPRTNAGSQTPVSHLIIHTEENQIVTAFPLDKRFEREPNNNLLALAEWAFNKADGNFDMPVSSNNYFENQTCLFIITPLLQADNISSENTDLDYLFSYLFIEYRNDYIYVFLGTGLGFIIIALIASKVISNYISRPLKCLEQQALKIAHKDWVEPMVADSNDEIGSLIKSINFMQSALQQADQEDHHFLQSISHDLKTPIMVIMSHAEAIKDGIYVDSLENTAEIIKDEALRLENKVKQILYYNTLDYALLNNQDAEDIDLSKLISYTTKRLTNIRPEIDFELSLKPIMIHASSERILVAIENILDNQIRYAKSYIRIVIRQDHQSAILTISNNGPLIPSDLLPNIFKHLYRGEKGKFGLGLAITYKIITFYGGSITAENTSSGVLFRIKIPLADSM